MVIKKSLGASNLGTRKVPPTFGDPLSASNLGTRKVPPTFGDPLSDSNLGTVKCLRPFDGSHHLGPFIRVPGRRVPTLGSQKFGSQHSGPVIWVPSVRVPSRHLTGPGSGTIWVLGPGSQGPIKCLCSHFKTLKHFITF